MFINEAGNRYGRLVVIEPAGKTKSRSIKWKCQCDCGKTSIVCAATLRGGRTISCGCYGAERRLFAVTKHGMAASPTYTSWRSMIGRCYESNNASYSAYGAVGVTVDERWHDFLRFYADMGERPSGKSLDRIDNSKGYGPENCRWSTASEQQNNRRCNRYIEAFGQRMTVAQWSEKTGINQPAIRARLRNGWPAERILSEPLQRRTISA